MFPRNVGKFYLTIWSHSPEAGKHNYPRKNVGSRTHLDPKHGQSRDSSVSIVTRLLYHRWIVFQFPAGARDFSLLQSMHTGCGSHPASYSMRTGVYSPGVKPMVRKPDHSFLSSDNAENLWSYTSTPTHDFMAGIRTRLLSFTMAKHYDRKLTYQVSRSRTQLRKSLGPHLLSGRDVWLTVRHIRSQVAELQFTTNRQWKQRSWWNLNWETISVHSLIKLLLYCYTRISQLAQ
jgi:hypothetical protein